MKITRINFATIKLTLLAVFTSLVLTVSTQAATLTVNNLSDMQLNDGACTLREAIINANADNQTGSTDCTAGAGTDTINITTAGDIILLTELPALTTSMTINGLGAASTTVRRDAAALTEFRIFTKTTGTSTISNLTARDGIVRGAVAATGGNINGGGINNTGGALTLTNVTVTNNQVIGGIGTGGTGGFGIGGGISTAAALTLTNSTVSNNNATGGTGTTTGGQGRGGGINLDNAGTLTTTGSVISGNTATGGTGTTNGGGAIGGGIFAQFSTNVLTINTSRIINNSATGGGGTSSGDGGGIYANNVFLTINANNSEISGNTARIGGGIYITGTLTITNTTVSSNSATGAGSLGGGMFIAGALSPVVTLRNVTVSNNSAVSGGGGIYVNSSSSSPVTLDNTIIANSTSGGDCSRVNGTVNAAYTLIEANLNCVNGTSSNNLTGDPNLGALANNGGTTQTHLPLFGSIAIDAGNSAQTTDQRGSTRPFDLATYTNAPGGNGTDIGAVELQVAPTAAGVFVGGRVTIGGRGLRNAVVYLTDAGGVTRTVRTSSFGYYRFDDIESGQTVIVSVISKRFSFTPQVVSIADNIEELNFVADHE